MRRGKKSASVTSHRYYYTNSGVLVFEDTFTDSNGTTLESHTPTGFNPLKLAWVKDNTWDLEIQSNKATQTGITENLDTYKETDHYLEMHDTDWTIECDMAFGNLTNQVNHAVLVRYTSPTSHIAAMLQTVGSASHALVLRKQDGLSSTDVASHIFTESAPFFDGEFTFRVVDNGSSISATYLGQTVSVETTDYNTATKVGIKTNDFNDQTWDNFKVYKT